MSIEDRQRWDEKYTGWTVPETLAAESWLTENVSARCPGRALDLACGVGHNAIWLAQAGWTVDAVDVSPIGLKLAGQLAARRGQQVNWIAADLDDYEPAANCYDLVVVFRFLDRQRVPGLIESALRPGGLLVYGTFMSTELSGPDKTLHNPAYAPAIGELPRLFPGLPVVRYREVVLNDRPVAQMVSEKSR